MSEQTYIVVDANKFQSNKWPGPVREITSPAGTAPKLKPGEAIEPMRTNALRQKLGQPPYEWVTVSIGN